MLFLHPGFQKQVQTVFLSSFHASLKCLSSHCAQPAQDMKQHYDHTLYPEYVYKGLINY